MTQALKEYNDEHLVQPPGTVRVLTEEVDVEGLVSSLLTKIPHEHVYLADLERDEDLESYLQGEETLTYTFTHTPENIENMVNFIITNHGGRLKSPTERRYEITRNGYVEVDYETEIEDGDVRITLEGQTEPVRQLKERFQDDLKQLDENAPSGGDR